MARAIDLRNAKSKADAAEIRNIHQQSAKVSPAELRKMKAHEEELRQDMTAKMAPEEFHRAGAAMMVDSRNAGPGRSEPKNQIEYLEQMVQTRDGMVKDLQEAIIDLKLELLNLYRRLDNR